MRVYHFLSAKNALDDLTRRRIKLSEIDKLNDPFELWCFAHSDRKLRDALRNFKKEMAQRYGLLCFNRRWHNPMLWSHYGDSYRGICLGFEVDEQCFTPVSYVKKSIPLQLPPTPAKQLLFTKYRDWSYEEEFRGCFRLEERDALSGHYFYDFDAKVQLREVIIGPFCDTYNTTIDAALKGYEDHIRLIKARLAFRTFQVVVASRRQGAVAGGKYDF